MPRATLTQRVGASPATAGSAAWAMPGTARIRRSA